MTVSKAAHCSTEDLAPLHSDVYSGVLGTKILRIGRATTSTLLRGGLALTDQVVSLQCAHELTGIWTMMKTVPETVIAAWTLLLLTWTHDVLIPINLCYLRDG